MKQLLLFTIFIGLLFAQNIDAEKSYVQFTVRNMGVRDVTGTIKGMQGTVHFNSDNLDSAFFDVSVNLNTIDTKNAKRDKHLKNEDFFETDSWATISFQSKRIAKQDDLYGVFGSLTIKDITKEVFVPFMINETDKTITFKGGETINRLDYNIGKDTNTFKVGDKINIEVYCIYNKKK